MKSVRNWTRRILLLLASSAGFFLPVSAVHAYCFGVLDPIAPPVPPGHVCGTIAKFGHNGSYHVWKPAGTSYVKICPSGSTTGCSTTTTGRYLDGWGQPVQAFVFRNYRPSSYQYFDFYIWSYSSNDYWGSSTKPVGRVLIGPNGLEGISMAMAPRPLPPTPVYPSGSTVPSSYTVRWMSGKDIDRTPYPTTYELWFKYWPFGGAEPANWSLSTANLRCQDNGSGPDASNQCSTYVSGPQLVGNWKWYMVANFDMNGVITAFPNTVFTTQSGWVAFTQPQ